MKKKGIAVGGVSVVSVVSVVIIVVVVVVVGGLVVHAVGVLCLMSSASTTSASTT